MKLLRFLTSLHCTLFFLAVGDSDYRYDETNHQIGAEHLTTRELTILQLLAEGMSNKEIAVQLYLSEKTIRNRLTVIYNKLGVRNRTEATLWTLQNNSD
jgi:two-component system NarL family response regulator